MKKFEDYNYHADFGSVVSCVPDATKNKFLATASLEDLRKIIPERVVAEDEDDLLAIAANACVINLGNKRGDMVSTPTALKIYQSFANKFINVEHDRRLIVGHLVNSGFSKFDHRYQLGVASEILKQEAIASDSTYPFNISIAGYIYSVAYPGIAKEIVEANDPESDKYLSIGVSWELAFDSYKVTIGNQTLAGSEIVTDSKDIEKYSRYLIANKGTGRLEDGRYVYRLIDDGVVPLGIGLTFAPAGNVAGVLTGKTQAHASEQERETIELTSTEEDTTKNVEESVRKSSQASITNVTTNTNKAMKTLKTFADLQNLTDETAKEYSFANVGNVLEAEISRLAKEHQSKLEAEAAAKVAAGKNAKEALASVESLKKEVEALKGAQAQAEATTRFNDRMSALDEAYELSDGQRKAVASQIRDLDDASYAKWKTDVFEAFASKKQPKAETTASAPAKTETEEEKKTRLEAEASAKETEAQRIAAEALKNAAAKKETIANTTLSQTSLREKYAAAFKVGEGVEIVSASRK